MLKTSEFMDSRLRGNDDPEIVEFNSSENDPKVDSVRLTGASPLYRIAVSASISSTHAGTSAVAAPIRLSSK